jgi:predicted transcriptional regulator
MGGDPSGQGGWPLPLLPAIAQLRDIACQLGRLAGVELAEAGEPEQGRAVALDIPNDEHIARYAVTELEWRSRRNNSFGSSAMLGEPTWELLLDLFVNWKRGNQVTVTSACVASSVPITTALRYISALVEAGLVARKPSPDDRRMHLVHLTQRGLELVRSSVIIRLQSLHELR